MSFFGFGQAEWAAAVAPWTMAPEVLPFKARAEAKRAREERLAEAERTRQALEQRRAVQATLAFQERAAEALAVQQRREAAALQQARDRLMTAEKNLRAEVEAIDQVIETVNGIVSGYQERLSRVRGSAQAQMQIIQQAKASAVDQTEEAVAEVDPADLFFSEMRLRRALSRVRDERAKAQGALDTLSVLLGRTPYGMRGLDVKRALPLVLVGLALWAWR